MSLIFATQLTAVATAVLAAFAVFTAWYARKAFREQSREVAAIEQQVKDEQEVTRQQAELLKVQTGQLEVLRSQLDDQRKASLAQAEVLGLQAAELRESLKERKRESERQRREQASFAFLTQAVNPDVSGEPWVSVTVVNATNRPVYDAELVWRRGSSRHGEPEPLGTLLPDDGGQYQRFFPHGSRLGAIGAVLFFRDAAQVKWVRRPDGYLAEPLIFAPS